MNDEKLLLMSLRGMLLQFAVMAVALFAPARTFGYWQAWVYLAAFFLPKLVILVFLYAHDRNALRARMKAGAGAESRRAQKIILRAGGILFIGMYLVCAFDYRHGWSQVPAAVSWISVSIVMARVFFTGWIFRENAWVSATIEVQERQKIVTTGPYAIVRHPLYLGASVMLLLTPPALGSWLGMAVAAALVFVLALRLLDEEKYLKASLDGYEEYCRKVRYRLVPYIW